jgi:hypothetical protein
MQKIVVNRCFGGFNPSDKAKAMLKSMGLPSNSWDIPRDNPQFVSIVEQLKDEANGDDSKLEVVSIPDDVDWEIEENDGAEWVSEKHRTW